MRLRRSKTTVVVLSLAIPALLATALPGHQAGASADSSSDGSGGRAIAHYPGGKVIKDRAITKQAPDARLSSIEMNAAEPTLGITKKGNVFVTAFQGNTRIEVVRSKDEGESWEVVSPKFPNGRNAQLLSLDPYLFVDEDTSRVFTIDLTVACAYLSFTDDEGESWTTNPMACGIPVNDHQTLFGGPPAVSPTTIYPNIMYYCFNDIASSTCAKSLDGGISFTPTGSPAYPGYDPDAGGEDPQSKRCGGLHGHGFVGDDGTVYIPKGHCGQAWLAISEDEGATWRRVQVGTNGIAHHESAVAADSKGNIYYAWVARDRQVYFSTSQDNGESWTKPMMVSSPGVKETNIPGIDVGGVGKVAIVYMGSENSPGKPFPPTPECNAIQTCPAPDGYEKVTWNGYMTVSANALDDKPVLYSTTVNDKRDPLVRQNCGPGRCRQVYDFIDIEVSPRGEVWSVFVDACVAFCIKTPPNNDGALGIVGRLVGGPSFK